MEDTLTPRYISKTQRKDSLYTPMFIAVPFTIVKRWKPKHPLADGENVVYTYNGTLFNYKNK